MAPSVLACMLLLAASSAKEQSRWSRQISTYTADISDWVPLSGPVEEPPEIKRQAVAEPRILSEPFSGFARPSNFNQDFSSRNYYQPNRPLYLQSAPSVPSAPQNFLSDQGFGQSIRFGLSQPNFPLSQGFVAPQYNFDIGSQRIQSVPGTPLKFDNFPKTNIPSPQAKPFIHQAPKKPSAPKFVDGYRLENASSEFAFNQKKKPQSLQKLKFDAPKPELAAPNAKLEREEVQLLYVPVDSLNRGHYNFRNPIPQPQIVNSDIHSQGLPKQNPIKQPFVGDFQRPSQSVESVHFGQEYYNYNTQVKEFDQVPKFSTIATPFPTSAPITLRPKKLKPHQPPLAVFLSQEAKKGTQVKVSDVLNSLKNANTIAVLDAVNPLNAPKVFIGPSTLTSPENYVKFELPYLSNIDHSDNKLRQLPFFVAPLSYHTPDGFAKIPFPSPHVGSVVINSQIKDSPPGTPAAHVIPNSYVVSPQSHKDTATPKPNFSYYSTVPPRTNAPTRQSEFYSLEPQVVTSIRPPQKDSAEGIVAPPTKTGSYFLRNQYPQQYDNFPSEYNSQEQKDIVRQPESTTTVAPTTTSKQSSTYSSQLLETHNPYSINQAFHFSTPLDYNNFFDEYKENQSSQQFKTSPSPSRPSPSPSRPSPSPSRPSPSPSRPSPSPSHPSPSPSPSRPSPSPSRPSPSPSRPSPSPSPSPPPSSSDSPAPSSTPSSTLEISTVKQFYQKQSPPSYLQNYTPEIHHGEINTPRFPAYNSNEFTTKTEYRPETGNTIIFAPITSSNPPTNEYHPETGNTIIFAPITSSNPPTESQYVQYQAPVQENPTAVNEIPTAIPGSSAQPIRASSYDQYETGSNSEENKESSSTTSSTTTTTRRSPIRSRGRPRYTTQRTESYEATSKPTRKPLRERRPSSPRPRYEPNKITTEKPTRKPVDSNEGTTKSSIHSNRSRVRGRVQFKPSDSDEGQYNKHKNTKDEDLAYQRDILHQNYPVTLMERMSTVDAEAITEPSPKFSSTKNVETPVTYDTENAYTNERASVSQPNANTASSEHTFPSRYEGRTETPYVPHSHSTREEYVYHSRSSSAPVDAISYDESSPENEDSFAKQTTPIHKEASAEVISHATEPASPVTEQNIPSYSVSISEKEQTPQENEETKFFSQETSREPEQEEEVQTTPSYNRVRVRPGVIRQYHQASSTEASKTKDKKRIQAITYRPAFERRRTTMRIEEIGDDLKTKQVHARPEVQEHRHPVYKPEPTTEPTATSASQESATKRGHFRRRRPNYTTTSTEASSTKKNTYEVKNRFRGRRPTEKPTDKPEVQTDASSTTTRTLHSRYTARPRLSERYSKKPEVEESEDQEPNYSINRPKFVEPESESWSPKISDLTFTPIKPYNPNDISNDRKDSIPVQINDGEGELDIITAKNEYDDILISVTPASNRLNKKIPDIPPTLEALVEQSKVTKSDTTDSMSTFETMLEEVMKSLEEQDADEYTTTKVMKHKGGEIGEIPPERIITSEDSYPKTTLTDEATTVEPNENETTILHEEENDRQVRRRGFWKKVKVRPAATESIEAAESQYYSHAVNRFGEAVEPGKVTHDKGERLDKPQKVTTYKPTFSIKDIINTDLDALPTVEISKIITKKEETTKTEASTENILQKETPTEMSPGDLDLGTGSPEPTVSESTTTEAAETTAVDRGDGFSFMDYLFGSTATGDNTEDTNATNTKETEEIELTTEPAKLKIVTTETNIIPEEITAIPESEDIQNVTEFTELKKFNSTEVSTGDKNEGTETTEVRVETTSASSFMDPSNVVSTSMSTEVSHETEICFRGKCIKTSKDIL